LAACFTTLYGIRHNTRTALAEDGSSQKQSPRAGFYPAAGLSVVER
jgi:hypothetical protein